MKTGSSDQFTSYRLDARLDEGIYGFPIWTVNYPELERESTCQRVLAHLNNFIEFHASAEGVP